MNYRKDAYYRQARARLSNKRADLVMSWADTNLWAVQGFLDEANKLPDQAALEEGRRGVLALLACFDEMLDRLG